MKTREWYVGIDLGGTSIKLAIITDDGEIVYKAEEATDVLGGGEQVLHQMNRMIEAGTNGLNMNRSQLKGIGIGAPAFLDIERGYVHEAVNLGWKNFALKDRLEAIAGLPVRVDNDANVAALGEMWRGAGLGANDLLFITLGTGVGGGVILNGEVYHGFNGTSGEIGHFTVTPDAGYPCNCGKAGCLETVASATGMVRLATDAYPEYPQSRLSALFQEQGKIEAKDITMAAEKGDELALDIFDQVGFYLGYVLGNYSVVMNPEIIVIGGGMSKAGDVLFQPIRDHYKRFALTRLTGDIDLVPATLGNDAGMIGAAWLVHTNVC